MRKNQLLLIFLFLFPQINLFPQVKGYIFDQNDLTPISFVNIWVKGENIGTTSNNAGFFLIKDTLSGKSLIFSSIGYEREILTVTDTILEVYLKPLTYSIPEVNIKPQKKAEKKIGEFKRSQLFRYSSPGGPQIFARHFDYKDEYSLTPFVSSIRIETFSTKEAVFNLRLFSTDSEGLPGRDILEENHLVKVKEGKKTNRISDLESKHIVFPQEGLFIAVEYLIIEQNEFLLKFKDKNTGKRMEKIIYMPFLGTIKSDSEKNGWVYRWGKWYKDLGKHDEEMGDENIGNILAVEITLTN